MYCNRGGWLREIGCWVATVCGRRTPFTWQSSRMADWSWNSPTFAILSFEWGGIIPWATSDMHRSDKVLLFIYIVLGRMFHYHWFIFTQMPRLKARLPYVLACPFLLCVCHVISLYGVVCQSLCFDLVCPSLFPEYLVLPCVSLQVFVCPFTSMFSCPFFSLYVLVSGTPCFVAWMS